MRTHPYAEAVYEVVVALATGVFGVKVSNSEASPATVKAALRWWGLRKRGLSLTRAASEANLN